MDAATLLQTVYEAYREKRLADILAHLDDSFTLVLHLPEDTFPGGDAPRGRAQAVEIIQSFMDTYDFLAYDPGPIIAMGDQVKAQPQIRFRHKKTGKVLETKLIHTWRVKDGKVAALDERYDVATVQAFLKSVSESGS